MQLNNNSDNGCDRGSNENIGHIVGIRVSDKTTELDLLRDDRSVAVEEDGDGRNLVARRWIRSISAQFVAWLDLSKSSVYLVPRASQKLVFPMHILLCCLDFDVSTVRCFHFLHLRNAEWWKHNFFHSEITLTYTQTFVLSPFSVLALIFKFYLPQNILSPPSDEHKT